MVSALIPSKRVIDGVRATAALPGVHLVCAGDGPERDAVDALANELMPERFTRLSVRATEMPALYRSVDTFLHLSLDEPFGNVFIEALSSGLPVVGNDSLRTRWIVGDHEFLCDTNDQAALVAALRAGLAGKFAGRNERRRRAQLFSWSAVARQYLDFFEQVFANRRHKSQQQSSQSLGSASS
jgi:glycosyltransferase involved in cell wall biosynthesis